MKSAKGIELGTIMDQLRYHLEIARRLFITFRFGCGSLVDYLYYVAGGLFNSYLNRL